MTGVPPSSIGRLVARALAPLIQMFGLYVLFHGHESPGGGFQGGAILASSVLVTRLLVGDDLSRRLFKSEWAPPMAAVGLLLYLGTGLLPLTTGAAFMDYGTDRWGAIMAVETGVALAVAGTIVLLFDTLREKAA